MSTQNGQEDTGQRPRRSIPGGRTWAALPVRRLAGPGAAVLAAGALLVLARYGIGWILLTAGLGLLAVGALALVPALGRWTPVNTREAAALLGVAGGALTLIGAAQTIASLSSAGAPTAIRWDAAPVETDTDEPAPVPVVPPSYLESIPGGWNPAGGTATLVPVAPGVVTPSPSSGTLVSRPSTRVTATVSPRLAEVFNGPRAAAGLPLVRGGSAPTPAVGTPSAPTAGRPASPSPTVPPLPLPTTVPPLPPVFEGPPTTPPRTTPPTTTPPATTPPATTPPATTPPATTPPATTPPRTTPPAEEPEPAPSPSPDPVPSPEPDPSPDPSPVEEPAAETPDPDTPPAADPPTTSPEPTVSSTSSAAPTGTGIPA